MLKNNSLPPCFKGPLICNCMVYRHVCSNDMVSHGQCVIIV
jgi:hypothetical protein